MSDEKQVAVKVKASNFDSLCTKLGEQNLATLDAMKRHSNATIGSSHSTSKKIRSTIRRIHGMYVSRGDVITTKRGIFVAQHLKLNANKQAPSKNKKKKNKKTAEKTADAK